MYCVREYSKRTVSESTVKAGLLKICLINKHNNCISRLLTIFGPRRDEVTGEWGRLHNEELNDLYSSPNIVRVIKWRRMRWAGHVARMGEEMGGV